MAQESPIRYASPLKRPQGSKVSFNSGLKTSILGVQDTPAAGQQFQQEVSNLREDYNKAVAEKANLEIRLNEAKELLVTKQSTFDEKLRRYQERIEELQEEMEQANEENGDEVSQLRQQLKMAQDAASGGSAAGGGLNRRSTLLEQQLDEQTDQTSKTMFEKTLGLLKEEKKQLLEKDEQQRDQIEELTGESDRLKTQIETLKNQN